MGGRQSTRSVQKDAVLKQQQRGSGSGSDSDSDTERLELKVVCVGDYGVGKSSLMMNRFVNKKYPPAYEGALKWQFAQDGTARSYYLAQKINTVRASDQRPVTLQVLDTGGKEQYQSLGAAFYHEADAAIFVYDVNSRASFEHITRWFVEFRNETAGSNRKNSVVVVVGNKIDLPHRQVSRAEGARWASDRGGWFFEVSAHKGREEVVEVFQSCTELPTVLPPK